MPWIQHTRVDGTVVMTCLSCEGKTTSHRYRVEHVCPVGGKKGDDNKIVQRIEDAAFPGNPELGKTTSIPEANQILGQVEGAVADGLELFKLLGQAETFASLLKMAQARLIHAQDKRKKAIKLGSRAELIAEGQVREVNDEIKRLNELLRTADEQLAERGWRR